MYYQLHALNWQEFEDLVIQLCHDLLGIGTLQFCPGPDGGRDAYFEGTAQRYPSSQLPWSGKLIIQAKHTQRADASCSDRDFVRTLLMGTDSEAEKIAGLRREDKCDGYLLFTNRRLPAKQAERLIDEFRENTGVPRVAILGREAISAYLNESPEIVRRFRLQPELIPAARFQIPQPKRDFTGRNQELAELHAKLRKHGGAVIYGMRGLGGVGKTELALKLAEEVGGEYSDGQILVELHGATDQPLSPTEALAQIIHAFEPQAILPTSFTQLRKIYQTILRDRRVLMLLDDAASAEQVEPLLPHSECLTVVTSRYRFALPRLHRQDIDALTEEAARDLLLSIAPRLEPVMHEIIQLLGRLPLALRLAGCAFAERPTLAPATFLERLRQSDLLMPVERAIQFNYEALSHKLRRCWTMLAVFSGGFDITAASAVWAMESDEAEEVLGGELYRVSLVECRDGRYRLHDLARSFAAVKLESEELQSAERRHAGHYLEILNEASRLYKEGADKILKGLHLFDREVSNIRTGQSWAASNIDDSLEATKYCSAYPKAGSAFLDLRLHPHQWIAWLKVGRLAAQQLGDREAEAHHLGSMGLAYVDLGDPRRAIECYETQLAISREIGDRKSEGTALGNLGLSFADLNEPSRAIKFHEQALEIDREIGNRRGEGAALGNLGIAYKNLGDPQRAINYYEQWLAIAQEIGDRRGEGQALGNLGVAYKDLGDVSRAIECYIRRLRIAKEIGDRQGEAIGSWNIGEAYELQGNLKKAMEFMQICVNFEREIGHPDAEKDAAQVEQLRSRLSEC